MRRIILGIILLIPILTIAQEEDAPVISLDESLSLSIKENNRATATFTIDDELEYVTLEVQSDTNEFDPVIWLVDGDNHLIAYNDNTDDETTTSIHDLLLFNGVYTVFVDSFNGVSEGNIELILTEGDPFSAVTSQADNAAIITVTLPEDMVYRHALQMSEGDIITLTAQDISGTLDLYLTLNDSNGMPLIENDDHQSADTTLNRLDARITVWIVPADGIYYIDVHDFLGNAGEFELSYINIP